MITISDADSFFFMKMDRYRQDSVFTTDLINGSLYKSCKIFIRTFKEENKSFRQLFLLQTRKAIDSKDIIIP